jgi:RimJ/RimL family protein N-acetyltransferase
VVLRAPRTEDVADRLRAGRDPEFRRMVGAPPAAGPLTRADAARWLAALAGEPHGWVMEHDGRCVGEARLHHVDAGEGWLALGLFAPGDRGRGLGTEAVGLLLTHAFGALGLARVRLRVLAFNARGLACYRRCGFREVGREAVTLDGGAAAEDILMEATPAAGEPTTGAAPHGRGLTNR